MRLDPVQGLDEILGVARERVLSGASAALVAGALSKGLAQGELTENITTSIAKFSLPYDAFFGTWSALRKPPKAMLPYLAAAGAAGVGLHLHKKKKEAETRERRALARRSRERELDRNLERVRVMARGRGSLPTMGDYEDEE